MSAQDVDWLLQPYRREHRGACLQIFDSNVPEFAAAAERPGFARFLDAEGCPYFTVGGADGTMVACGGYAVTGDRARLCWGLVHRAHHRRRLGRRLLHERLRRMFEDGARCVRLDTSQKTCGFFERSGFRIIECTPDGYRPGLDRIEMELLLSRELVQGLQCG